MKQAATAAGASFLGLAQRLSEQALSLGKPEDFWPVLAKELAEAFGCERITLFQSHSRGFVSCYATGSSEQISIEDGEGIAGHAAKTRKSCISNSPYEDPLFSRRIDKQTKFKTANLLGVPLIAQGKVVGVVELVNKPGGFTIEDAAAMEFLGAQIALHFMLFSSEKRRDRMGLQMMQMEKMAAIGRLVAGFTHEVRNPLFIIMGFADKLLIESKQKGTHEDAARIKTAAKRIEHMVKNLLSFSRASAATMAPFHVPTVIETSLELVALERKAQTTRFIKQFHPETPSLNGNINTIMQVFINLIMNAVQAMDGMPEPKLTLKTEPSADKKKLVVEVIDNGPGISPENMDRIFEPFFTTKGKEGTGLGLSIVRDIVESHQGQIAVKSAVGKGTTFTLTFPGHAS